MISIHLSIKGETSIIRVRVRVKIRMKVRVRVRPFSLASRYCSKGNSLQRGNGIKFGFGFGFGFRILVLT